MAGSPPRTLALVAAVAVAVGLGLGALDTSSSGAADAGAGRFAFTQSFDGGFSHEIVVTDAGGGDRRRIDARRVMGRPAFSPDGTQIAFSSPLSDDSDGRYGIYVVNVDGSGLRRLTAPANADLDPAWSPDGRSIAFTRDVRATTRPDTCCSLFVMRADGSGVRQVPGTTGARNPAWSPDSARLAYEAPDGLRVTALDGSGARRLVGGRIEDPAWSPDGRTIALVQRVATSRARLSTVPSGGGSVTVRANPGELIESPVWDPDGRTLYSVRYRGLGVDGRTRSAVWRTRLGGGDAELFRHSRPLYGLARAGGAATPLAAVRVVDGDLRWLLTDAGGAPTRTLTYGRGGATPILGDWEGHGRAVPGVVRADGDGDLVWRLAEEVAGAARTRQILVFGRQGALPVVGDWNGDGRAGVGVVRDDGGRLRWRLANDTGSEAPSVALGFDFGDSGEIPVVGDWNGDGRAGVGVVRDRGGRLEWRLANDLTTDPPPVARTVTFGNASSSDAPVAGDWDGDGQAGVGVVRPVNGTLRWLLADDLTGAEPTVSTTVDHGRTTPLDLVLTSTPAIPLVPVPESRFTDVVGNVHAPSIEAVAEAGIAQGYPDGTFRPRAHITRGQMATLLAGALDLPPAGDQGFTDTAGHTHADSINAIAAAGLARGHADGTFRPNAPTTRGQMATLLAGALDL